MSRLEDVLARMLRVGCLCESDDDFLQPLGHHERKAEQLLATPEGKALSALVEAAVAWRAPVRNDEERGTRQVADLAAAVDAYLALGDA